MKLVRFLYFQPNLMSISNWSYRLTRPFIPNNKKRRVRDELITSLTIAKNNKNRIVIYYGEYM
jgi:hypothetical protein